MLIGSVLQIYPFDFKPSAPPVGGYLFYMKTDNVLYLQDSGGNEYAFGSTNFISQLTGDVSAIGPGSAVATVNSVGGQTAAAVASGAVLANASTASDVINTIIRRDGAGDFAANVASLFALKLNGSVTGVMTIAPPPSFTDFTLVLPNTFGTIGQALITDGAGNLSWASILTTTLADGKILVGNSSNIATPRTPGGDVSMSDIGAFTVNTVGTSSAANIHAAELLANAATSANTPSTIVRRDANGAIALSSLTAFGVSDIIQAVVKGFAGQGSDVFQVQKSDGTVYFQVKANGDAAVLGNFTAANFGGSSSGSNTGDVTAAPIGSTPNANGFTLTGQALNLEPANGLFGGVVTVLAQTFAGIKTFLAKIIVSDTTQSIDKDTGSIVTEGGLGVEKNINAGGAIAAVGNLSGANFSGSSSGTNTGDVTKTDTNSIALSLSGQNLSADLKISTDPADATNLKMTTTVHGGVGAAQGLHVEVPFGNASNVGTSNNPGSSSAVSLADHVHAITIAIIGNLVLTGYTIGANAAIAATDTIFQAFGKLQAQINATVAAAITGLTGDVTATGPGNVAATIAVGAVTDTKASLSNKPAVTVVAITNQALTGTPTIDGQTTTAGTSIVLLSAQTTAADNGPWVVQTGAWTRPTWYPNGGTTQSFQFITTLVRLGTTYQGSTWRQTTAGPITIGTTATAWAVVPLSGNYKSVFNLGPATGSANVDLNFANAFVGTLRWNPTANQTLTLPPTQGAAGTVPFNDGTGILSWANPLLNIDGGRPDSVYTASQFINGGTP